MATKTEPEKPATDSGRSETAGHQDHLDAGSEAEAWDRYKNLAADYARKAQQWKDAKELAEVRCHDLVNVHKHTPFEADAAVEVGKEAARALENEEASLRVKQDAKKALDAAWTTVQAFNDDDGPQPLVPDEE